MYHHHSLWFMFLCLLQSLSSWFNYTSCLQAVQIYFTAIASHFLVLVFSTLPSFMVINFLFSQYLYMFIFIYIFAVVFVSLNAFLIIFNLKSHRHSNDVAHIIGIQQTEYFLFQIIASKSPMAPQETDQGFGNHPNLCFRSKMEIELSHSHHHLESENQ